MRRVENLLKQRFENYLIAMKKNKFVVNEFIQNLFQYSTTTEMFELSTGFGRRVGKISIFQAATLYCDGNQQSTAWLLTMGKDP